MPRLSHSFPLGSESWNPSGWHRTGQPDSSLPVSVPKASSSRSPLQASTRRLWVSSTPLGPQSRGAVALPFSLLQALQAQSVCFQSGCKEKLWQRQVCECLRNVRGELRTCGTKVRLSNNNRFLLQEDSFLLSFSLPKRSKQ